MEKKIVTFSRQFGSVGRSRRKITAGFSPGRGLKGGTSMV